MEDSTGSEGNTLLYKLWKNEGLFSKYIYIKLKKFLNEFMQFFSVDYLQHFIKFFKEKFDLRKSMILFFKEKKFKLKFGN